MWKPIKRSFPQATMVNPRLTPKDCPKGLPADIANAWKQVLKLSPLDLLRSDSATVLNAARVLAELDHCQKEIQERGRYSESSGRQMAAPWATSFYSLLRDWLKYSTRLGLDPTGRQDVPTSSPRNDEEQMLYEMEIYSRENQQQNGV